MFEFQNVFSMGDICWLYPTHNFDQIQQFESV